MPRHKQTVRPPRKKRGPASASSLPPPPPSQFGNDGPPPPPPPAAQAAQAAMYHFRANQNTGGQNTGPRRDRPRDSPRGFDFRAPRPKLFERPLLTTKNNASEELTFRSNHVQDKFREVNNLSDTDEEHMEMSEEEVDSQPSKRARLGPTTSAASAASRWSNPDPYTSLPPVDDSNRKHKDVVKLIRKARIDAAVSHSALVTNGDDFISFDLDDENDDIAHLDSDFQNQAPPDAPTGPRANVQMANGPSISYASSQARKDDMRARWASSQEKGYQDRVEKRQGRGQQDDNVEVPALQMDAVSLGKRKREETLQKPVRVAPRERKFDSDGMVLMEWQPSGNANSTPWFRTAETIGLEPAGISLHKEIIDFYEWIKPRDFEHVVRADLISRLQKAFERLEPGGQLKAFGSFAAGLYLPTGDMDLVYLQSSFKGKSVNRNGIIMKPPASLVRAFASFIANKGIAQPGTVKPIFAAKVPIIKFVERVSGLKVDLSFNNDTGVVANSTFHKWKVQYPAMPIVVSVVKHFLMMRGLNDVAYGGIGGFSVICLVTSLIQHFPTRTQPPNLGMMLVEFFNLYGNLFNRRDVAIRLDPPSYIEKRGNAYLVHNKEKPDCLSIIDPHRPDNNISAGSHEIQQITSCFRKAYEVLQCRLDDEMKLPAASGSLLEDLLGGNFTAYEMQRESLKQVHNSMAVPPPPSFAAPRIPPPPPPPNVGPSSKSSSSARPTETFTAINQAASVSNSKSSSESEEKVGIKTKKNKNRAARFQELRPDVPNVQRLRSLTIHDAIKVGGYKNSEEMNADLEERAKAAGKSLSLITA